MSEDTVEVVIPAEESVRHQLSKLVIVTVVAFAAGKLAEKGYDAALAIYRQKTNS